MDSASLQFVLFGLSIALLSNAGRSRVWRSFALMAASIVFLGLLAHNLIALLPLAAFLSLGYAWLLLSEREWFSYLPWGVSTLIFTYIWLKKYTFLPHDIFLKTPYLTLGLSYIFFRVLHLCIESAENRETRHIGLGAYLLYTLNFTTLVSGPIQRYDDFAHDQFASDPLPLGSRVIGLQLERIVRGFFKVNVLAMLFDIVRVGALVQLSATVPVSFKLYAAFRLALVYPLFLYANFSGYIDIVIALARLMRVRLPENFDRPFTAASVLDFWNRWHITLSTWLKTYVYNPLLVALMRRIPSRRVQPLLGVFAYFVTFFLIGLWHGRTSEFIIFGLLTGGGVSFNKLWQLGVPRIITRKRYKELTRNPVYVAFCRGLNFVWFSFTLLWFWNSWLRIDEIFGSISLASWLGIWLTAWFFVTGAVALWERLRTVLLSITIGEVPVFTSRYARVVYASAFGLAIFVMSALLNQPAPDIVYRAF